MNELSMFGIGLSITVLFLLVGHWFPWPRPLPRLHAYTYGVGAIIAGVAIWKIPQGDWVTPLGLVVMSAAAGFAVWFGYAVDSTVVRLRKADKAESVLDDEFAQ